MIHDVARREEKLDEQQDATDGSERSTRESESLRDRHSSPAAASGIKDTDPEHFTDEGPTAVVFPPRHTGIGLAVVLALTLTPTLATSAPTGGTDGPRIVAVRPNPAAAGDAGEFVAVDPAGHADLVLSDGETSVPVPERSEPVALAAAPAAAERLTDRPVAEAPGLALANGGEQLRLRRSGQVVDRVAYDDAPEAERYADGRWLPVGLDPRRVRDHGSANGTAFILPDSPTLPLDTLESADRRLLLAGYTLTDPDVVDAVVAAHRRGIHVRVLLEGEPVGGRSRRGGAALDRLTRAGVPVRLVGGERARFAFHHPKYAVVDDHAVVTTENWDPGGIGGADNRGWGVRVDSTAVADDLAGLFRADFEAGDTRSWQRVRPNATLRAQPAASGTYSTRIGPEPIRPQSVRVLTAPGNAGDAVVDLLDGARHRVDVLQPGLGGLDARLVRATLDAARRGVRVRVLLASAWYVADENRALVERLNALANQRDLPLSARLADPNGRYGSIHAKGVVVDDTVVVGSLNWNEHAATENREVALALTGGGAAAYYRRAFVADWRGGRRSVPVGLVAAVAVAVGLVVAWGLRRR